MAKFKHVVKGAVGPDAPRELVWECRRFDDGDLVWYCNGFMVAKVSGDSGELAPYHLSEHEQAATGLPVDDSGRWKVAK